MRFGQIRIELQRALARFPGFLPITGDRIFVENEERKTVGVAGLGEGEIRVQIEGLAKHPARKPDVDFMRTTDEVSPPEVIVVGRDIAS